MSDVDEVMALVEKLAEAAYGNGHEAGAIKDYVPRVNELTMELAIRERLEAALNHAYAEGRNDETFDRLSDAWVAAHGKPIPWEKAVEILAIVKKLPEDERARLLALAEAE